MEEAGEDPPVRQYAPPKKKTTWCTAPNIALLLAAVAGVGCWFGDEQFSVTPTWTLHLNATGTAPVLSQRIVVPVSRVAPTVLLVSILLIALARRAGGTAASVLRRLELVLATSVITALLGVLAGCVDFWLLLALFQLGATQAIALILQDFLFSVGRAEHLAHLLALFAWIGSWIVVFDHVAHTRVPQTIRGALGVYFVTSLPLFGVSWYRSLRGLTLERVEAARDFISVGARTVLVIMLTAGLQAVKRGILV
jgi:hypothetical protein